MANIKRFTQGYTTGGTTPRICIQRDVDAYFLNGSGVFVANAGAPFLNSMTQKYAGFWEFETSAAVWDNGLYNIVVYSSSATTDTVLSAYSQTINADTQIGFIEASSITAKNAVASLKPDLQTIEASLAAQGKTIQLLSDRVDSLQQVLSRRDYKE